MDEYGIYSDEGMVEGPFHNRQAAEEAAASYDPDDEVKVWRIADAEGDA